MTTSTLSNPSWVKLGLKYLKVSENPSPTKHNQDILSFWDTIRMSGVNDDETPWCAAYVGAILELSQIKSTRSGLAKSYLNWGTPIKEPTLGCIVVFTRKGGGHVGFVVGKNHNNDLYVLGGNQSDQVSIKLFKTTNVVGYRWPIQTTEKQMPLPILSSAAEYETKVT